MTNWKKTIKGAVRIRQKFIEQLDDNMEPEAIISAALSIIYQTTDIFEGDFVKDFSTFSELGQFLMEHSDEEVSIAEAHGQIIFIASCGETCEVIPPVQDAPWLNYIS